MFDREGEISVAWSPVKRRLVTAALPYVNNVPHLGNLVQVLSADVFARFCRQSGFETLYICGTDEYGTATESQALRKKLSPQELCNHYHKIHAEIYRWFSIQFDHFGQTSTPAQTTIVQKIFSSLEERGYITAHTVFQLYCQKCSRFLADRYVDGTCPFCHYQEARGDQCESCGKLLDPQDLVAPRCSLCSSTPIEKSSRHLFLDLPKARPLLEKWMTEASVQGGWSKNAIQLTRGWLQEGLKERCITRDLKWGVSVPKEGFEDKVFYVWFDAPIGYISITSCLTQKWQRWWCAPEEVELYQFVGKDNIPFHTIIFPSTLLASGTPWTLLHHLSSSEYLNYEGKKFSKSRGTGVFGADCQKTGIPSDVWRFYLLYNRPEKTDYTFTWKNFQQTVNSQLIGNLGNLVNRTFSFLNKFYNGHLTDGPIDQNFLDTVSKHTSRIKALLDRVALREAFHEIFFLCSFGNRTFQEGQPWKTRLEAPSAAAELLRGLLSLICDLALLIEPYLPQTAHTIAKTLGLSDNSWSLLGSHRGPFTLQSPPQILFQHLEDAHIQKLRERHSGEEASAETSPKSSPERFAREVDLRVGVFVQVDRHPKADRLYVSKIDCGEPEPRIIVSGLVPYYQAEELVGKRAVVVANLRPALLRGIKSQGMILAAQNSSKSLLEILTVPEGIPGERLFPRGFDTTSAPSKNLEIDSFSSFSIKVTDGIVEVEGTPLLYRSNPLHLLQVREGIVE